MATFAFRKEILVEEYLNQLNESQREAVLYTEGPELVIAGAGSGKTRVLTYKIAYLMQQGLPPWSILALTFTNKAAREMKERIAALTEPDKARRLWMGTFHSIFSRILRSEAERLGYTSNFTIYDSADSKNLLKSIIKEMHLDDKMYRPGMIQARISNAKNALVTWRMYEQNKDLVESDMNAKVPMIREIYKRYQSRCFQAGAMDFDDLLLQTNILFRDHPDVLDKYRSHFQYILVDEYQDTNFAQHQIVQRLSELHGRICVVGDDAQSIYSFRGANIENVLQLQKVYPNLRLFKLEQNYRSTQNIVDAANSLIHKNKEQIHKTVFSEKEKGSKVSLISSYSDYEEAYVVASKITEMRMAAADASFASFAVLYRTNAQSRTLEEALRKRNIPYKIYGGLSFYQRKEIKDVIAYLRVIINPHDEEALKRIINYPIRGIGDTTVGKLLAAATEYNVSLWKVLEEPETYAVPLNNGTLKKLAAFREMMDEFMQKNKELPADEMTSMVVKKSGIATELFRDRSVEGISKQENLEELLKGISEYIDIRREEGLEQISLEDFLSEVALLTDQDNDKEENVNKVTLMTIHAAKGLEFRNVFVVGLEEDLFPSLMSKDNPRAIEEERRLFYVAITRAEENCILTYAKSRFRNGKSNLCSPSRFLKDIDPQYLHVVGGEAPQQATPTLQRPAFASPFQQPKAVEPRMTTVASAAASTTSEPPADVSAIRVGAKVKHDRFGSGEVLAIEGEGGNMKATVQFANFGQKQLLLKFARLSIIE
ncbi:DNA helicase-2/ATP-dependent DNA helicase PcrA [Parabacteroides sp. PF5-5]|uniref:ATP-dependent helicase n=1 Tax=unclassified Parabacteroides TaxID=2649774 RepID=UPI0024762B2E|nr:MULTISPECIES: UvrD-helicase domain-containing protein [unclassified Parabacteroides]MDH6304146.1 DNA helicase-2/ATP-dependent DNA helicase PcrA [Parabacteroides sp. PH5-39]MDH6315154.1 DNA helicase-2/ATP-dependent DNA helicase PcrA [Parabacteroides sp. PF5-13]MDH6318799.1 DNA helicase-2/ATP-dependent DNA helicase PcrA [Parabacteroides sp. PH5-13]MDH6322528.1 DNA helicase-2/ATP-dependent DNA helicase PcrA [Parabacteroides sp. PH5-8]MDH6326320.1 DNA helicase-2/ATP-dependent DNA helicase PcrA 